MSGNLSGIALDRTNGWPCTTRPRKYDPRKMLRAVRVIERARRHSAAYGVIGKVSMRYKIPAPTLSHYLHCEYARATLEADVDVLNNPPEVLARLPRLTPKPMPFPTLETPFGKVSIDRNGWPFYTKPRLHNPQKIVAAIAEAEENPEVPRKAIAKKYGITAQYLNDYLAGRFDRAKLELEAEIMDWMAAQ